MKKVFLVFTGLGASLSCHATEYILQPSFRANERFDDNFRLQANSSGSNFISTLSPTIKFALLKESGDLEANFGINQIFYSNEPRLEATEKLLNGSYSYNWERLNFSLNGNYSILSAINTELDPEGSGILLNINAFRTNRSINPSLNFQLTEKNALQLNYSYNDASFDRNNLGNNLIGFVSNSFLSSISHRFSPRQSLSLSLSYSLFNSATNQNSTTTSIQAGWQFLLNENTRFRLSIGQRSTDSEFPLANTRISSTTIGQIFSANIVRTTEWGSVVFSAGQQLNPASIGQQQQTTTFSANANLNINERWSVGLNADYLQTESAGTNTSSSRTLSTLSPSLNWRWTPDIRLQLSYSYRQQSFQTQGIDATGNNIQLQFSFSPPTNRQVK